MKTLPTQIVWRSQSYASCITSVESLTRVGGNVKESDIRLGREGKWVLRRGRTRAHLGEVTGAVIVLGRGVSGL